MKTVIYRNRVLCVGVLLLTLGVLAAGKQVAADEPLLKIEKIYFMIHPVCWRLHQTDVILKSYEQLGRTQQWWTDCCRMELESNQRQMELISRMKPTDALVIFPISRTPPMLELEEHGKKTLGRRCIVVQSAVPTPGAGWAKLPNPIERFLNDPNLEGKAKFLETVPPAIQEELAAEIRQAWEARSGDWNVNVLKVIYYSRLSALEIQQEFQNRNLQFDPATVESESFGEGFEQCAMTWKQMMAPYLGLVHGSDNIFELSFTAAPYIMNKTRHERVKLGGGICLFLWDGDAGERVALFARSSCRLKDPQLFARVPLAGMSAKVCSLRETKRWPDGDLTTEEGCLKLPVLNGIRRDAFGGEFYLIAEGIPMDQFRKRLVEAKIGP